MTKLLAAHLRKMRNADSIVIHHSPRVETTVTCNKDADGRLGDRFEVNEARVVTYNDVCNSRPGGRLPVHLGVRDACWVLRPSEIASVLAVAKPGDTFTPVFIANNNNNTHVAAADLTVDELHVELTRWTPSGRQKVLSFMVATNIGPPGSVARNVRYIPTA